jgi:DnaJ domain
MLLVVFLILFYSCLSEQDVGPENQQNIYDLLDLPYNADSSTVIGAYRRTALKYHSDHNPDPRAHDLLKSITNAKKLWEDNGRQPPSLRLRSGQAQPLRQLQNSRQKPSHHGRKRATEMLSYAAAEGVIGLSVSQLAAFQDVTHPTTEGQCRWQGKAPPCWDFACPPGYDAIRRACSSDEAGFGHSCFPGNKKTFCCIEYSADDSWAGRWMRSTTGELMRCNYIKVEGHCGIFRCLQNSKYVQYNITGDYCDEFYFDDCKPSTPKCVNRWLREGFLPTNCPNPALYCRTHHAHAVAGLIQLERHPDYGDMDRFYKVK